MLAKGDDNKNFKSKKKRFILREVSDRYSLYHYFRLRYQVYLRMKYINSNKEQLDIEAWDLRSKFIAAFEKENNKLVGTLRIVHKNVKCQCYNDVSEIIETLKDERFKTIEKSYYEFPLMQAFDIKVFLKNCYSQQRTVVEVGRLSVLPEYWKNNLALVLSEFAISYAYENAIDDFIIAVHPRHARMYERLGFKLLPNTVEIIYPGINNLAIALHLDLAKVNEPSHSRALEMQQSIKKKGYFKISKFGRRR